MRLDNLSNEAKARVKSGDIKFLKNILAEEYEEVKEDLIYCTVDKSEQVRGRAMLLTSIIKLLP